MKALSAKVSVHHTSERRSITPAKAVLVAGLLATWPASAIADGVIISSTDPAYETGMIVRSDDVLSLENGASITVLDQSGEIFNFSETGRYNAAAEGHVASAPQLTLAAAATNPGQRSDIGGTRAEDFESCLEHAETREDLTEEDCSRAFPPAPAGPELDISLGVRAASVRPSDPLYFKLTASFDSIVTCGATDVTIQNDVVPLLLSSGGHSLHLMKEVVAMAPQRGSPRLVAPDSAGTYRVSCLAVSPDTWAAFDAIGTPPSSYAKFQTVLAAWSEVRGGPTAQAQLDITVKN